jgi:hypothetical protein
LDKLRADPDSEQSDSDQMSGDDADAATQETDYASPQDGEAAKPLSPPDWEDLRPPHEVQEAGGGSAQSGWATSPVQSGESTRPPQPPSATEPSGGTDPAGPVEPARQWPPTQWPQT